MAYSMNTADQVAIQAAKATEQAFVAQLNDLVKKGLLDVEQKGLTLWLDPLTNEIKAGNSISLHLRDKAYIERLEKENAELKQFKETIKAAYGETKG